MYEINNKPAAIRHIQNMLGINESGIYDSKTKNSVILHQRSNSLKESGIVDYLTFISIVREFNDKKLRNTVTQKTPFKDSFPYKKGDSGDAVNILNSMLRVAIDKYRLSATMPRGPYYSDATSEAVEELRGIFMLPREKYIDEQFYDRLLSFVN